MCRPLDSLTAKRKRELMMLWMKVSTTLRRSHVLRLLLPDTQTTRRRGRAARYGHAASKLPEGTANRHPPEVLPADFLMEQTVLWRPILRTLVRSAAFFCLQVISWAAVLLRFWDFANQNLKKTEGQAHVEEQRKQRGR